MIHTFLSDAFLIYVYSRGCKIGEDDRPRISICHFMEIAIVIIIIILIFIVISLIIITIIAADGWQC